MFSLLVFPLISMFLGIPAASSMAQLDASPAAATLLSITSLDQQIAKRRQHSPTSQQQSAAFTCQGKREGYFADVTNGCRQFFYCSDMHERDTFRCPIGKTFDEAISRCEQESLVKCGGDVLFPEAPAVFAQNSSSTTQLTANAADALDAFNAIAIGPSSAIIRSSTTTAVAGGIDPNAAVAAADGFSSATSADNKSTNAAAQRPAHSEMRMHNYEGQISTSSSTSRRESPGSSPMNFNTEQISVQPQNPLPGSYASGAWPQDQSTNLFGGPATGQTPSYPLGAPSLYNSGYAAGIAQPTGAQQQYNPYNMYPPNTAVQQASSGTSTQQQLLYNNAYSAAAAAGGSNPYYNMALAQQQQAMAAAAGGQASVVGGMALPVGASATMPMQYMQTSYGAAAMYPGQQQQMIVAGAAQQLAPQPLTPQQQQQQQQWNYLAKFYHHQYPHLFPAPPSTSGATTAGMGGITAGTAPATGAGAATSGALHLPPSPAQQLLEPGQPAAVSADPAAAQQQQPPPAPLFFPQMPGVGSAAFMQPGLQAPPMMLPFAGPFGYSAGGAAPPTAASQAMAAAPAAPPVIDDAAEQGLTPQGLPSGLVRPDDGKGRVAAAAAPPPYPYPYPFPYPYAPPPPGMMYAMAPPPHHHHQQQQQQQQQIPPSAGAQRNSPGVQHSVSARYSAALQAPPGTGRASANLVAPVHPPSSQSAALVLPSTPQFLPPQPPHPTSLLHAVQMRTAQNTPSFPPISPISAAGQQRAPAAAPLLPVDDAGEKTVAQGGSRLAPETR